MRTTTFLAALGITTVANGMYTIKLHRKVAALATAGATWETDGPQAKGQIVAATRPPEPPLLKVLPTLPLPAPIAADADRELLRQFVAGEVLRLKEEKKEAKRVQKEQKRPEKDARREQQQAEYNTRLAKEMGLGDADAGRLVAVLANADSTRRRLKQAEQSGQATSTVTETGTAALREKIQADLRALLGDGWSNKLVEARRRVEEVKQKERQARAASQGPFWFASQS